MFLLLIGVTGLLLVPHTSAYLVLVYRWSVFWFHQLVDIIVQSINPTFGNPSFCELESQWIHDSHQYLHHDLNAFSTCLLLCYRIHMMISLGLFFLHCFSTNIYFHLDHHYLKWMTAINQRCLSTFLLLYHSFGFGVISRYYRIHMLQLELSLHNHSKWVSFP